jgi:hypothetical protein
VSLPSVLQGFAKTRQGCCTKVGPISKFQEYKKKLNKVVELEMVTFVVLICDFPESTYVGL